MWLFQYHHHRRLSIFWRILPSVSPRLQYPDSVGPISANNCRGALNLLLECKFVLSPSLLNSQELPVGSELQCESAVQLEGQVQSVPRPLGESLEGLQATLRRISHKSEQKSLQRLC